MRRKLAVILAAVLALGMLAVPAMADDAPANEGGYKIGYLNPLVGNTWRAGFLESLEAEFEAQVEAGNVSDYEIVTANADATEQLNQLNAMINDDYDAILISAVSATALEASIEKAVEKGILVLLVDNGAAIEGTVFLGNSNYIFCESAMQFIADKMDAEGKTDLVFLMGLAGNEVEVERDAGRDDVLANYPDIKIVAEANENWSATDAQAAMATLISSLDNIDAVYCPEGGEGVLRAYENAGLELPIFNSDYTYSALQYWKDNGLSSFTVPSDTSIGATSVKFAIKMLNGEELDESKFEPNPLDPELVNFICLNPPYVVVDDEEAREAMTWLSKYDGTQVLTLDEALALCEGHPSTYMLSVPCADEVIDSYFK